MGRPHVGAGRPFGAGLQETTDVSVESPCISVCQMDENGYCIGCGRTIDEIRGWKRSSDDEKRAVLARAVERQGPSA